MFATPHGQSRRTATKIPPPEGSRRGRRAARLGAAATTIITLAATVLAGTTSVALAAAPHQKHHTTRRAAAHHKKAKHVVRHRARRKRATKHAPATKRPVRARTSGGGSTPPTSTPFIKGVNVDPAGWGSAAESQISSQMSTLGVGWARIDLGWADVEKSTGVYDWSNIDADMAAAAREGIHVLPVVGYAPSWTQPEDAKGYASFVAAVVKRYGPGTSANLTWFELWNEPNSAYAWSGKTADPSAYAKDVRAASQAAKQVAPSVKVLMYADYEDSPAVDGASQWQTSMIDDYFTAVPDLGKWIDGIATHPYSGDPTLPLADPTNGWKDTSGQWGFARLDQIHNKFLAHGANLPVWITEAGWSTYNVSASQQAHYYGDLITAIKARPWIRALFPYCLREWGNNSNDQSQYGLLTYPDWTPKPAYQTLAAGFRTLS